MKRQPYRLTHSFLMTKKQHLGQKILLNICLDKKLANIIFSAEKGHQMMPFLLLVRQILFKDFSEVFSNS
ncbi:hypothetical protein [Vibrio sp. St2]|uniref:hypothetical protein n=1 Tax=Vibrio sp. St2 TaxID=2853441 RepID=UPI00248E4640|nr:hypothetical protein [Vibrio sp. St2]